MKFKGARSRQKSSHINMVYGPSGSKGSTPVQFFAPHAHFTLFECPSFLEMYVCASSEFSFCFTHDSVDDERRVDWIAGGDGSWQLRLPYEKLISSPGCMSREANNVIRGNSSPRVYTSCLIVIIVSVSACVRLYRPVQAYAGLYGFIRVGKATGLFCFFFAAWSCCASQFMSKINFRCLCSSFFFL